MPQDVASGVPKEELERAKLAAMSSVYMNLESRAVVAEDIGRQILTYGHRRARLPLPDTAALWACLSHWSACCRVGMLRRCMPCHQDRYDCRLQGCCNGFSSWHEGCCLGCLS